MNVYVLNVYADSRMYMCVRVRVYADNRKRCVYECVCESL